MNNSESLSGEKTKEDGRCQYNKVDKRHRKVKILENVDSELFGQVGYVIPPTKGTHLCPCGCQVPVSNDMDIYLVEFERIDPPYRGTFHKDEFLAIT